MFCVKIVFIRFYSGFMGRNYNIVISEYQFRHAKISFVTLRQFRHGGVFVFFIVYNTFLIKHTAYTVMIEVNDRTTLP